MEGNTVFIIIGIVLGGAIIAIIAYQIARFMRGTIKLHLAKTAFNPGENITGSFDLHTKKNIQGNRLIVSLIGTQVTKSYKDGKTETRSHEIYRNEVLLEDAKDYSAGTQENYNFEIPVPNMSSPEFLNSPLGQTLSTALSLVSNRTTRNKWKVEARLDAKGVDLASSIAISINNL